MNALRSTAARAPLRSLLRNAGAGAPRSYSVQGSVITPGDLSKEEYNMTCEWREREGGWLEEGH